MTGDDRDGQQGPRVAQLRDLLDTAGARPGGPVADLGGAGGDAEEHRVAGLADLAGLPTPDGTAERATLTLASDALRPVERAADPVAGLDGDGVGAAAAVTPTADLGSAAVGGRRRSRPAVDRAEESPRPARRAERRRSPGRAEQAGTTADPQDRPAVHDQEPAGPDADRDGATDRGRRSGRRAGGFGGGRAEALDPDADPVAVARDICLRLLSDRARTRHELAQALSRKGVPDDAAEQVLGRFDEVGLIDDAAFAGQWVRSRHQFRGLGRRAIAQELRRKGVDAETAGEALAEVDGAAEEQRARQLVDKKLRTMRVGTGRDDRAAATRRLVGMLARKGYGAGVAYGVVKAALADHGADVEEFDGGEPADD